MENTFQEYKEGFKLELQRLDFNPNIYEKDLKLLKLGILVKQNDDIVINPVVKKCNTLTTAKARLKKEIGRWLKTLDAEADKQEDFIIDMVSWYKDTDMVFTYQTNGDNLMFDLNGVPFKYANGKGKAYLKDGRLIAFHYGHAAINAPSGCEIYNAHTDLNCLILS